MRSKVARAIKKRVDLMFKGTNASPETIKRFYRETKREYMEKKK